MANDSKVKVALRVHQQGYSLLEVSLVMLIIALISSFLLVWLRPELVSKNSEKDLNLMWQLLKTAKQLALIKGYATTICPVATDGECHNQWTQTPIYIFIDNNQNRTLDSNEAILHQIKLQDSATLIWRNQQRYLVIDSIGNANQAGTFSYCNHYQNSVYGFQLVISRTARARLNKSIEHCDSNS